MLRSYGAGSPPLQAAPPDGCADSGRLLRQGRIHEAVETLRRSLGAEPDRPELWARLAMAYVGIDRSAQARPCFERSLDLAPDQPALWTNYGTLLLHAGEDQAALAAFAEALRRQPDLAAARRNAAMALFALGRDEEARRLMPPSPDRCVVQGQALRERGDLEAATDCYREALRLQEREGWPEPPAAPGRYSAERGRTVLLEAKARLDGAGIPFLLWAGTLLGIVREGDLLPHDKDLDLAVGWGLDRDQVVEALCADGAFAVPWFWGVLPSERPWYRSFTHAASGTTLDVFFLGPDGDALLCGFDSRPAPVLSRISPVGSRSLQWQGRSWRIPDPPERYLEEIYGPEWRKPDPGYDTILSNPSRVPGSIPLVVCQGYLRVYQALAEGRRSRAFSIGRQLLQRRDDPFLSALLDRLESHP